MSSDLPYCFLLPNNKSGLISINDVGNTFEIKFLQKESFQPDYEDFLQVFYFLHSIPESVFDKCKKEDICCFDINICSYCQIMIDNVSIHFGKSPSDFDFGFKFCNLFAFNSFLSHLCSTRSFDFVTNTSFNITKKRPIKKASSYSSFRNSLTSSLHDLYAHQSLLNYLGLRQEKNVSNDQGLLVFNDSIVFKLISEPKNASNLANIARSSIPFEYSPLIILLLLIDKPVSLNRSKCGLFFIDDIELGGSHNIKDDFLSLKRQWSTISVNQFSHMNNLRISLKLLENSLLSAYPVGHPLIKVVFSIMSSLFIMRDEFQSYVSEIYQIAIAISELFFSSDIPIDTDLSDGEHLLFWLLYAMITKTGVIEFLEQRSTESILSGALHIIIMLHPLLYSLIEKAGINSFRFPSSVIFSLYTKVLNPHKLYPIWVAALSTNDPMQFFHHLMASSLILLFPKIVDCANIVEQLEKELKKFYDEETVENLIFNTLKLMEATNRN